MLPERITRELRYIEIYTARKMRNLRVGTYTAPLRGPGFDFDEHRPYRPGDDVRRIDWNVTARLRQPFVRETHAERELNVIVALDLSASMAFGTAALDKKELMLYIAGVLRVLGRGRSDQPRLPRLRPRRAALLAAAPFEGAEPGGRSTSYGDCLGPRPHPHRAGRQLPAEDGCDMPASSSSCPTSSPTSRCQPSRSCGCCRPPTTSSAW